MSSATDAGQVRLRGRARSSSPRSSVDPTKLAVPEPVLLEWRCDPRDNVLLPLEVVKTPFEQGRAARSAARQPCWTRGPQWVFEDKRPSEASGGMRQRASPGQLHSCTPQVLILDEPFRRARCFTREGISGRTYCTICARRSRSLCVPHHPPTCARAVFWPNQVVVLSGVPGAQRR